MDISNVKDKIVYVASPYAGDIEKNVRYAQDACRAVLLAGAHPYAPHLYITNILREISTGTNNTFLCISQIMFHIKITSFLV